MLPDLHTGFSRDRSGGLVFPSLSEFSTVYFDPHVCQVLRYLVGSVSYTVSAKATWNFIPYYGLNICCSPRQPPYFHVLKLLSPIWLYLEMESKWVIKLVYCCSVTKSYPTPCDPIDCSSIPVLHYLPEFAQMHVRWVSDAIEPSHPLPPSSPLAFN